jgi:hypothetical protein
VTVYRHTPTGEQVQPVPDSYEDRRMAASPDWQVVTESATAGEQDTPPADSPPAQTPTTETAPAAGAKKK